MLCSNCGNQIQDNSEFCMFCGNAVKRQNYKSIGRSNSSRKVIIVIIAAALLVSGSIVFHAFANRFSLYSPEGGRFKMDKLTGDTYILKGSTDENGQVIEAHWYKVDN